MKKKFRLNQLLDKVIPNLIFLFAFFGPSLVLNELIPFLFETTPIKYHRYIVLYKLLFLLEVSLALGLYLSIYFNFFHLNHQLSAQASIKKIINRSIVYRCVDTFGSPLRCNLCNDSIIPLRGRHCFDCETCIVGFDHHCVWFARCIGITDTLKPFIQVLTLAAGAILTGLIPLYPIVTQHVRQVIQLTWSAQSSGDILRQVWWNRWWCWAGGPIHRYLGGLYLGYYYYPQVALKFSPVLTNKYSHDELDSKILGQDMPNPRLGEPMLSALLITASATMILLVIIAMLVIVIKNNIMSGLSTVEIERARRWKQSPTWDPRIKLWIPDKQQGDSAGTVVLLPPGIPIFDLGPKKNFQQIMGNRVWHWFVPWNTDYNSNGIEWPISDLWMDYLRKLEPYHREKSLLD